MKVSRVQKYVFIISLLALCLSCACSDAPNAVEEVSDAKQEELINSEWESLSSEELLKLLMGPKYDLLNPDIEKLSQFRIEQPSDRHIKSIASTTTTSTIGMLDPVSSYSLAYGINDSGAVAGNSLVSTTLEHGFYWNGAITDLGALYSNSFVSAAGAVNNADQVSGYSYIPSDNRYFASLWDPAGGLFNIGALTGSYSSISIDVNENGVVAGVAIQGSTKELFIWDHINKVKKKGYPLASVNRQFNTTAINNLGIVAGVSSTANGVRSYTWDAVNGFKDLGSLGGTPLASVFDIEVADLNDNGQLVGQASGLMEGAGSFFWDSVNGIQFIADPDKPDMEHQVHALNEAGVVAGAANGYDPSVGDTVMQAFVWSAQMGFQYLGFLGQDGPSYIAVSIAYDLNDEGGVAGMAINPSGQTEAVTWTFSDADTTPPELSFTTLTDRIWPPNRSMVLAMSGISATDDRDGELPVSITVTGSTDPTDIEIVTMGDGTQSIYVRAEGDGGRGRQPGERFYGISLSVADAAGNQSIHEQIVRVSRN